MKVLLKDQIEEKESSCLQHLFAALGTWNNYILMVWLYVVIQDFPIYLSHLRVILIGSKYKDCCLQ